MFAVRAFKHAIFGTPQPPPTVAPKLLRKKKEAELPKAIDTSVAQGFANEDGLKISPTKQGILLTPGTVRGKKKEVTFGAQVVDNESKKSSIQVRGRRR